MINVTYGIQAINNNQPNRGPAMCPSCIKKELERISEQKL